MRKSLFICSRKYDYFGGLSAVQDIPLSRGVADGELVFLQDAVDGNLEVVSLAL